MAIMQQTYPEPEGGASLLLSCRLQNKTVLVLGSGPLAASRVFASLEANASVIVLAKGGISSACDELRWRAQQKQVLFVDWDGLLRGCSAIEDDAATLDKFLGTASRISLAIVTDTTTFSQRRSYASAKTLYDVFQTHNIPVNVPDMPDLCDFSFTASHRFMHHENGGKTSLQIGVTTNGRGCRFASRLRREIVTKLPRDVGAATQKIGEMRSLAATSCETAENFISDEDEEVAEDCVLPTPNRPVFPREEAESASESRKRQMRWVAQISEYWPISKLASMTRSEMQQILAGENMSTATTHDQEASQHLSSRHFGQLPKTGRILLVGSGPGHPSLLTVATHTALTQQADVVLSDKLVPDAVLALIPKHVHVRIARKFPGNADGAQVEMMEAAVEAAKRGLTVVRLKQGDPTVFARLGEEVLHFRSNGFEPTVIPGVSSALAAPTFAGIPLTQRGVAESFVVCTGVGRKGKEVILPGYERSRTLVILMGVARIKEIVTTLLDLSPDQNRRDGAAYPQILPISIIERGSMPDQRVMFSTLKDIVRALECSGEQRPPGMMVIGWAVLSLYGEGDVNVLDSGVDNQDDERIRGWLREGDNGWRIQEGLAPDWERF